MRLTQQQIETIRTLATQVAGEKASLRVFGSRIDDHARGGDLDLLLSLEDPVDQPVVMAATLAARVSRTLHGRKVDVVILAPNLTRQPIHDIALQEGILL